MNKEKFAKKVRKLLIEIKDQIINFFPNRAEKAIKLLKWTREKIIKNKIIYKSKKGQRKNEEYKRRRKRGEIYWTQFGQNIGSEFNGNHFSAVLYESLYTAIVVPLSSKKENEGKWKNKEDLIIDIGVIEDLPRGEIECYALVHQIRTVSKKRLDTFKDLENDNYINLKLTNRQLDLIDEKIKSICK